jgi:hypothetical protein
MDLGIKVVRETKERERNDRILYLWIAVFVSHLVTSYHDFLVLFAPTS